MNEIACTCGQTMRTLWAASAWPATQRMGPSWAILRCCQRSTATLQPPCSWRNSARATTVFWKAGHSAGYTSSTETGGWVDVGILLKSPGAEICCLQALTVEKEEKTTKSACFYNCSEFGWLVDRALQVFIDLQKIRHEANMIKPARTAPKTPRRMLV